MKILILSLLMSSVSFAAPIEEVTSGQAIESSFINKIVRIINKVLDIEFETGKNSYNAIISGSYNSSPPSGFYQYDVDFIKRVDLLSPPNGVKFYQITLKDELNLQSQPVVLATYQGNSTGASAAARTASCAVQSGFNVIHCSTDLEYTNQYYNGHYSFYFQLNKMGSDYKPRKKLRDIIKELLDINNNGSVESSEDSLLFDVL